MRQPVRDFSFSERKMIPKLLKGVLLDSNPVWDKRLICSNLLKKTLDCSIEENLLEFRKLYL